MPASVIYFSSHKALLVAEHKRQESYEKYDRSVKIKCYSTFSVPLSGFSINPFIGKFFLTHCHSLPDFLFLC